DPQHAAVWTEVFDQVTSGQMPPKKKARPPAADAAALTAWVKQGITTADLARRTADGRVVLRRLNRNEYGNTVRDLLGVEVDLEDLLPEDSSAMGFDNVAAALNTSSVLMERYLEAADAALDAAIQSGPRPAVKTWDVGYGAQSTNPNDYRFKQGVRRWPDGTWTIFNAGEQASYCDAFRAPAEGWYRFRVTAYAQFSDAPLTMSIVAGGFDVRNNKKHPVGFWDVPPGGASGADVAWAAKAEAVPPKPLKTRTIEFTEYLPKNGSFKVIGHNLGRVGLDTPEKVLAHTKPGIAILPVHAEGPLNEQWPPAGHRKLFGDLDLAKGTPADAERVITQFAARAFRRPVSAEDVAPMLDVVRAELSAGRTFEQAVRVGLKGVLCSPSFLFLWERPGKLDQHAVASRLSYFLWSSTPDDELRKLADGGNLTKPDVLRAQVERLLKDPRAERFVQNFTGQWLMLRQIEFTTPDKKLYPEHDDVLQWSMPEETHGFFRTLLADDLSVANVIDSDWAFLNGRLATHYGIPGVTGTELRRVKLPAGTHRGGVLGQAAVLKVTANGTVTSPIVRGAWVMRNILGRPPKNPPPNVPAVEPDIRGATTIREQLAKHRAGGACTSCHAKMDPPGFALESFDVIGGWRENYRAAGPGGPKGRKSQVMMLADGRKASIGIGPAVEPADTLPDGRAFSGFDEFKKLLLADQDQVAKCLTEKLLVYGTGGGLDFADRTSVDGILARTKAKGFGLRTLVHEVVQSEVFLSK
ncbi:MAG TPA: DUF1592 domain-containing protein, partial [Humisphaera sp.]